MTEPEQVDEVDLTDPDLRQQADKLTVAVVNLMDSVDVSNRRIQELGHSNQNQRRLIRLLFASVLFDVLLSLGLGYAIAENRHSSEANRETLHQGCVDGNRVRAGNVILWEGIVRLSPAPTTPEQQARTDQVLALVHDTFAPRDCDAI